MASRLAPWRLRRRLSALSVVIIAAVCVHAGVARADPAPQQWEPTAADLVRTVRPCPMQVDAPVAPVCWSMTEDTTSWATQPPGSPYPWGQCTYYAALMRPDIWNDRAPPAQDPLADDWDAWTWVEHAQAEGLAVDDSPQPGDVMVYSRAAVGNDVGHVAIVDAVDGTDPSTGALELTVSEMNVEGLDDAAEGQGDTSTILVAQSELAPGMIQFIHQPGPGYVAPAWPHGSDPSAGTTAATPTNPSLSLALAADHLETVTRSPAPLQAIVTAASTGATVEHLTVAANQAVALDLPAGAYRVCITQTATGNWAAATACATGTWSGPLTATIQIGRPGHAGARISLPLLVGSAPSAGAIVASASFSATATITIHAVERGRSGTPVRMTIVYRRALSLRVGRQAVRLTLPRGTRLLRGTTLNVRVTSRAGVVASGHAAVKLG